VTTLKETLDADAQDVEETAAQEEPDSTEDIAHDDVAPEKRTISGPRVLAYGVLPAFALLLALAVGYFRWVIDSGDSLAAASTESVRAASEGVTALLSYKADSADKELNAARDRLTGEFKDAYTSLIREVVIPGAKEKHINATAKVSAAASVSATDSHAVVLLYVNQTVTIGEGAPTDTQPVIRATLDKVNGRWLISHFDPV
jgi:Mce-associated membrane protein